MTQDELLFLGTHMEALPLYETFREAVLAAVSGAKIRVEKAQITFAERRGFAFLSLHPARRSGERPPVWMTVSFGLGYRKASPRIDAAVEPYPGRWTHHVTVGSPAEIDAELLLCLNSQGY